MGDLASATGEWKGQVFALFRAIFPDSYPAAQVATPSFFGQNFTLLEVQLCQEVLWEVYKMGFRLELLAMDRLLCPAGGDLYNQVAQEQQRMANILQIFN